MSWKRAGLLLAAGVILGDGCAKGENAAPAEEAGEPAAAAAAAPSAGDQEYARLTASWSAVRCSARRRSVLSSSTQPTPSTSPSPASTG